MVVLALKPHELVIFLLGHLNGEDQFRKVLERFLDIIWTSLQLAVHLLLLTLQLNHLFYLPVCAFFARTLLDFPRGPFFCCLRRLFTYTEGTFSLGLVSQIAQTHDFRVFSGLSKMKVSLGVFILGARGHIFATLPICLLWQWFSTGTCRLYGEILSKIALGWGLHASEAIFLLVYFFELIVLLEYLGEE